MACVRMRAPGWTSLFAIPSLLFLFLFSSLSTTPGLFVSAAVCPSWRSQVFGMGKKYSCPEHSDPIGEFKKLVDDSYYGQRESVREVMNRLKNNIFTDYSQRKVLVMHFSGPTGVGKTLLADTLAKALFKKEDVHGEPCGGLKLIMKYSLSVLPEGKLYEAQERELLKPIVQQLDACPRSLILIDDIHWLTPEFMDCLKPALRGEKLRSSTLNKSVDTNQAIFILSSDLESGQRSIFTFENNQEDAKKEIRKLANDQLKGGTERGFFKGRRRGGSQPGSPL